MKVSGITRVRNESHIITDTLNHVSQFVDEIYVYDDCSTDDTVRLCKQHPKVKIVVENKVWSNTSQGRDIAEGSDRKIVHDLACKGGADWIYCFDADEFADFEGIDFTHNTYKMRLFDFYATPEDAHLDWKHRTKIGPEYNDIIMLYRAGVNINYKQREPLGVSGAKKVQGYVKHFSKAISEADWEMTCDYYIKYFPRYAKRWIPRKGKYIHTLSDFGRELITWEDRKKQDGLFRIR